MTRSPEELAREWLRDEFANALDDDPELLESVTALIRSVRNEAVEECAVLATSSRQTDIDPIGSLHSAGWNGGVVYVAQRLRALITPTEKGKTD